MRTTFDIGPTFIDAAIRGVTALLSVTVATVFPPTATVAEPVPITTSWAPLEENETVHFPVHFRAPVPYEFAALHVPVLLPLAAVTNV